MSTNTFESHFGGLTVRGEAHSLSAWFVVALRLMIGYAFLHSGLDKLLAGEFDATGYLLYATAENGSPAADLFATLAGTEWLMAVTNVMIPWGEVLIGAAVLLGLFTRFAAFWGAVLMFLFYIGNWDVAHGYVNGDFAYMLVFLAVAAFGAGRLLGADAIIERYEAVRQRPWLKYLLG